MTNNVTLTKTKGSMLTTFDNPFNPFEDFSSWFLFDVEKGYNSCGLLDRIANFSEQLSEKENDEEMERAIDEIIKNDFMHIYTKVNEEDFAHLSNKEQNNKETTNT